MRGLSEPALGVAAAALIALAPACHGGSSRFPPVEGPLLEMFHFRGRPNEKPVIPGAQLETLVRFDPKLPAYRLRKLRFLLGAPGRIVFSLYRDRAPGGPGEMVAQVDRRYGPELVSSAEPGDTRWVVEELDAPGLTQGPFWVGLAAPERHADPRLWGENIDSGQVYERELDGSIGKFRHTPVLRVEVEPRPYPPPKKK